MTVRAAIVEHPKLAAVLFDPCPFSIPLSLNICTMGELFVFFASMPPGNDMGFSGMFERVILWSVAISS